MDDLFSDEPQEQFDELPTQSSSQEGGFESGLESGLNDQKRKVRHALREEKVEAHLEKCAKVMDVAHKYLQDSKKLREAVFGSEDEAFAFTQSVEERLSHDDDFKALYEVMKAGQKNMLAQLAQDEAKYSSAVQTQRPKRNKIRPTSSGAYVPGAPVNSPAKSETSRKNHILRKDMV